MKKLLVLIVFLFILGIGLGYEQSVFIVKRLQGITPPLAGELQDIPPLTGQSQKIVPAKGQLLVPILMYHYIRKNPHPKNKVWENLHVSPEQFAEQLKYLSDHGYHSITLDDLDASLNKGIQLPDKPIILTFDDGYISFYTSAFPLLKQYNMKAIEFIITKGVSAVPSYLTWSQIEEMNQSPLISFGAHTQHHPSLTQIQETKRKDEIIGSKNELESHLHKPVRWFAYPYGSFNNPVILDVQSAGFSGAVSTVYGAIQSKETLFTMPRIMVSGSFSLDDFARRIEGQP